MVTYSSSYLLTPCGNTVRVYSRRTGELLEELVHHDDMVTDIVLDRKDKAQVCNCLCIPMYMYIHAYVIQLNLYNQDTFLSPNNSIPVLTYL